MERPTHARLQRRPVQRRRPAAEGNPLQPSCAGRAAGSEAAGGPVAQMGVLQRRQRHPLARLDDIGRQHQMVAVELRLQIRPHLGRGGVAEQRENLRTEGGIGRGCIRKAGADGGAGEILRRSVAEFGEEARVHPLQIGQAGEDRPDVLLEHGGGRLALAGGDERRLYHVVERHEAGRDGRRVIGADADEPGGIGAEFPAAHAHHGIHRAVAGVVGPAVIVGIAAHGRSIGRGMAAAGGGHHHEAAVGVGHHLAEIDRLALKGAAIEPLGLGPRPGHGARPGNDGETGAIRDLGVAAAGGGGAGQVERNIDAVPERLGIGDGERPGHLRLARRHLAQHAPLRIIGIEAEARGLLGHGAGLVLEGTNGHAAGHLGTEMEGVLAVAHPRHADGGMDGDARHPLRIDPARCGRRLRGARHSSRKPRREPRNECATRQHPVPHGPLPLASGARLCGPGRRRPELGGSRISRKRCPHRRRPA